jgi:hypothetical protein
MAAMIITGMTDNPRYPMIKPPKASPDPVNRPALLRISDRDMCPRTIAAIAAGNINNPQTPLTKLAIALPLVSDSDGAPGTGGPVTVCAVRTGSPHRSQNWLFSPMVFPHLLHNMMIASATRTAFTYRELTLPARHISGAGYVFAAEVYTRQAE